jgi:hypothetical protein
MDVEDGRSTSLDCTAEEQGGKVEAIKSNESKTAHCRDEQDDHDEEKDGGGVKHLADQTGSSDVAYTSSKEEDEGDKGQLLYTDNMTAVAAAANEQAEDTQNAQPPRKKLRREEVRSAQTSQTVAQLLRQRQRQQLDQTASSSTGQQTMAAFMTDVRSQIAHILQSHQLLVLEVDVLKRIVHELVTLFQTQKQQQQQNEQRQRRDEQQQQQKQPHVAVHSKTTEEMRSELLRELYPHRRLGNIHGIDSNLAKSSTATGEGDRTTGERLDLPSMLAAQQRQQQLVARALSGGAIGSGNVSSSHQLQLLDLKIEREMQGLVLPGLPLIQQQSYQQPRKQAASQPSSASQSTFLQLLYQSSHPSLTPQNIEHMQEQLRAQHRAGEANLPF